MNTERRTLVALALQLAALAVLSTAIGGLVWFDTRNQPRLVLLVDRSASMPRDATDRALSTVMRAAQAAGSAIHLITFAGRPAGGPDESQIEPTTTNIAAALEAALAQHARSAFDRAVVITDGQATTGDTESALRAVRDAGLPLHWIGVEKPPPETRIAEVLAPQVAHVGQRLQITLRLAGRHDRPLRVEAIARQVSGDTLSVRTDTPGGEQVIVELDPVAAGPLVIDLALRDPTTGQIIDRATDAAVVDVIPAAPILYVKGSADGPAPLARSLTRGGWTLKTAAAVQLDAEARQLGSYGAVILDDVAVTDASERSWQSLAAAVRQHGTGLLVLGGARSFALGGYRESTLESLLPVVAEPAALGQPVNVVFAVDKSGSMGRGSAGVDRFALAQRAVLASARGFSARDRLGLLVFDVQPRTLIALSPLADAMPVLERDWPTSPNGGTQLAPAIDAAIDMLDHAGAGRRLLVLVTDGFVEAAPVQRLRQRLARSHVETIALAVGPDADAGALEQIVGADGGLVLRVAEAAELPQAMRAGVERRRARVEHGTIGVTQSEPLPFPPTILSGWPPIAAHAATRPRAEATVSVRTERDEPIVAWHNVGRGRVAVVTSGLGAWAPQWLRWREWPRLAGRLADWISAASAAPAALVVADRSDTMTVQADLPPATTAPDAVSITVDSPAAKNLVLSTEVVAPGRLRAVVADSGPGLYRFSLSDPPGAGQTRLHLRRHRAESEYRPMAAAIAAWRREGLIEDWRPELAGRRREPAPGERQPVDRPLVALALALFLAGVGTDRAVWTVTTGAITPLTRRLSLGKPHR